MTKKIDQKGFKLNYFMNFAKKNQEKMEILLINYIFLQHFEK